MNRTIHNIIALNSGFSKKWIFSLFVLICLLPGVVKATHIIGGEINYTCLGGEQYEVELTVYRDCFFGADNAFFDDPASIGIFDSNGVLLDELKLPYLNNDTLTPILSDSCLFVPNSVCVHTASYRGEVNLPFSAGGYTIVYQRCCRNETITNIVDPLNTGATFTATVSGTSLQECNSGPKFKEFPPLFICVNEPINWDHSAIDIEGDSLVYSLCAPYAGGDIINNQPQPAAPPPYATIVWSTPFGLNNILGGTDVLAIHPSTGLITGTPPIQGQFVVGICIEEYKDGAIISTSRRDFQYNVGECGVVAASIGNDTIQCENQELTFINTTQNSNNFEWYFGDASNPGLNSELINPTFMFPDTGVYTITLIAEPNGECADTLVQDILFKNSTLDVDFDLLVLECVDSVLLTVNNMSIDSFLGIEEYDWTLSDGQSSDLANPTFVLATTQQYTLTLTATAFDGCSETKEFEFFANVINSGVVDTFNICPGQSVNLNDIPFLGPNVSYTWSPAQGLDDVNSPNPSANPTETTMYTVSIDDPNLDCSGSFSVLVDVQEDNAIINFENDEIVCTDEYTVSAQTDEIVSYEWSQDPSFSTILSEEASFQFSESGLQTFYLRTVDERGCAFSDEVTIAAGALNVEATLSSDQACLNQPIIATAVNSDPIDNVTITWEPAIAVLSGQGTLNASLNPLSIGENIYFAFITNQFGCSRVDTFTVNVISDQSIDELDIEVNRDNCDPSIVSFNVDHVNITNYQWEFADGTEIIEATTSVEYTFPGAGTYAVTLAPKDYVNCGFEEITLQVEVPVNFFDTGFSSEVTTCGDIIGVTLMDQSTPIAGSVTGVEWTFEDGQTASGQTIALEFMQGGTYPFAVTLTSDLGCTTTYEDILDLTSTNVLDVSFIDQELLACNGDPVEMNPNGNVLYTYAWSPPAGLSAVDVINPLASPSNTSTYTVVVTDPTSGCVVQRDVTVTVPEVQLDADFIWAFDDCIGTADIQLTDQSVYSEAAIIGWAWSFSGTNQTFTEQNPIVSISVAQDLEVTLTVTTEDGCEETIVQTIIVDIVELNLPADNTFICFGESIELNPGGSDEYTYVWSPATGLSTASGANPTASPATTTTYTLTVSDEATGCMAEEEFTIVVAEEELQSGFEYELVSCDGQGPIEIQFTSTSVYIGGSIINYDWTFDLDGLVIESDEANPLIAVDEAGVLSAILTVTAEDGCSDMSTIEETINIIEEMVSESSVTVCNQEPVMLNENGDQNLTYVWSPATGLSDANIANPLANPDQTTIYTVSISNLEFGTCVVTQEVEVIVPVYEIDVNFDASYLSCGATAEIQFTDLSTTSGTDIVGWSWSFGNGMTSDEQNPVITIDESSMLNASLTVTTIDGCEEELLSPQSLPVDLILIDEQNFESMLNVCMGESVFLNDEPNDEYTYSWSPADLLDDASSPNPQFLNADASTTFTVTISNISTDTCSVQMEVFVNVFDTPNPSINGVGQEAICSEEGELSVDLGAGETVVWYDDVSLTNVISTDPSIITMPGEGTTYYAMVSNEFGCGSELVSFESSSKEIDLDPEIAAQILCVDSQTELNAVVNSTEVPTQWSWSPEGQIDEFLNESSVLVSPTENTTYTLTGTNDFGCSDEITFDVLVQDLGGQIDATIQTSDLITGQPITLSVTENDNYTYSWSPANLLDDPTSANPTFTLTEEVTFEVEVTDENGCFVVLAVVVVPADTPCAAPYVFVPNAFSPNGDGLNEQLRVDGNQITEMYLAIYNRWGERVFEATDQSQTWDGTYHSKPLDPDVFGYIFTATCSNGDTFSTQGNITLLE